MQTFILSWVSAQMNVDISGVIKSPYTTLDTMQIKEVLFSLPDGAAVQCKVRRESRISLSVSLSFSPSFFSLVDQ